MAHQAGFKLSATDPAAAAATAEPARMAEFARLAQNFARKCVCDTSVIIKKLG